MRTREVNLCTESKQVNMHSNCVALTGSHSQVDELENIKEFCSPMYYL